MGREHKESYDLRSHRTQEGNTPLGNPGIHRWNWKNLVFHRNWFFGNSGWNWGGLGGVRGAHGAYEDILSNLAGFGLTWHRKVDFSTFDGKLEGSFIAKCLQMGFWISPKARGFWLNGLRRKSILKNGPKEKYFPENWSTSQNHHLLFKWLAFSYIFWGWAQEQAYRAKIR